MDDPEKKIVDLIQQGNVHFPGAEKVFPLNLNKSGKKEDGTYEFSYCELVRVWGPWSRTDKEGKLIGNNGGFELSWGVQGFRYGSLTFRLVGGKTDDFGETSGDVCHCDNEMMSKEFIKQALIKFAENIILDDDHEES